MVTYELIKARKVVLMKLKIKEIVVAPSLDFRRGRVNRQIQFRASLALVSFAPPTRQIDPNDLIHIAC